MADTDIDTAQAKADKAAADALAAQQAADEAALGKSPEQVKADKAAQKADDLAAEAAAAKATAAASGTAPMLAVDAATLVTGPAAELMAHDNKAQKQGNDPANPKPAPGIDGNAPMVKLSRKTPDVDGLVYGECPEAMVGDYLRAGWNRA